MSLKDPNVYPHIWLVVFVNVFSQNFYKVEVWNFRHENVAWDRIPSQMGEPFCSQNISL